MQLRKIKVKVGKCGTQLKKLLFLPSRVVVGQCDERVEVGLKADGRDGGVVHEAARAAVDPRALRVARRRRADGVISSPPRKGRKSSFLTECRPLLAYLNLDLPY